MSVTQNAEMSLRVRMCTKSQGASPSFYTDEASGGPWGLHTHKFQSFLLHIWVLFCESHKQRGPHKAPSGFAHTEGPL